MKGKIISLACVALVAVLAGYGCDRGDTTPEQTTANEPMSDATRTANVGETRVADIVGEPDRYFGQTVTVVADVEEVHSPMAFSLDEDAPFEGGIDRDLVVLSPEAANLSDIDDQWLNNKVRVRGKVGRLTVVEIEREVGWDLNPEIEAELEGASAVIIAESIERVEQ